MFPQHKLIHIIKYMKQQYTSERILTTKATLQITIISMSNHPQNVQTLARTNVLTHLALLLNHLQKDKMSIQTSTADSTKPLDPN